MATAVDAMPLPARARRGVSKYDYLLDGRAWELDAADFEGRPAARVANSIRVQAVRRQKLVSVVEHDGKLYVQARERAV